MKPQYLRNMTKDELDKKMRDLQVELIPGAIEVMV